MKGDDEGDDHDGQEGELQHRALKGDRVPLFEERRELRREDQDPPRHGDETHDQEGLRDEGVLPEGDLNV